MNVADSYKERAKAKFYDWVVQTKMNIGYCGPVKKMIEVNGIQFRCKGEVVLILPTDSPEKKNQVSLTSVTIEREDDEDMWAIKLAMGRCREYCKRIESDPFETGERAVREYWRGILTGMASRLELISHLAPREQYAQSVEAKDELINMRNKCSITPIKAYIRDVEETIDSHIAELSNITGLGQNTFLKELSEL